MSGRRVDAKVVLLGQEGVGKSSLVERCAHGRFRAGPYQNVSDTPALRGPALLPRVPGMAPPVSPSPPRDEPLACHPRNPARGYLVSAPCSRGAATHVSGTASLGVVPPPCPTRGSVPSFSRPLSATPGVNSPVSLRRFPPWSQARCPRFPGPVPTTPVASLADDRSRFCGQGDDRGGADSDPGHLGKCRGEGCPADIPGHPLAEGLPRPSDRCHVPSASLSPQDTAGSERYEAMSRIYYRGARAAIVCYGEGTENGKAKEWRLERSRAGVGGGSSGSGTEQQCQQTLIPLPRSHGQWQFPASQVLGERAAEL